MGLSNDAVSDGLKKIAALFESGLRVGDEVALHEGSAFSGSPVDVKATSACRMTTARLWGRPLFAGAWRQVSRAALAGYPELTQANARRGQQDLRG